MNGIARVSIVVAFAACLAWLPIGSFDGSRAEPLSGSGVRLEVPTSEMPIRERVTVGESSEGLDATDLVFNQGPFCPDTPAVFDFWPFEATRLGKAGEYLDR